MAASHAITRGICSDIRGEQLPRWHGRKLSAVLHAADIYDAGAIQDGEYYAGRRPWGAAMNVQVLAVRGNHDFCDPGGFFQASDLESCNTRIRIIYNPYPGIIHYCGVSPSSAIAGPSHAGCGQFRQGQSVRHYVLYIIRNAVYALSTSPGVPSVRRPSARSPWRIGSPRSGNASNAIAPRSGKGNNCPRQRIRISLQRWI